MYWIIFASRQKRFKGQAMANLIRVAILALVCVPAFASISSRRATITGGGPQGKCTIEVSVDETADVEVFGDNGVLRTLSGQPAFWKRFVCKPGRKSAPTVPAMQCGGYRLSFWPRKLR